MAFDKKAYNRAYYQRNKDLWQTKYGDGPIGRTGTPNPNYVTSISKSRDSRYGAYGQSKAAEEARKRTTSGMNSRYGAYGRSKAAEEARKHTTSGMNPIYGGPKKTPRKYIDDEYEKELAFNSKKNVYPEGMTAANVGKAAKNGAKGIGIGGRVAKAAKEIRPKYITSMVAKNLANRYKKGVAHDVRDSLERLKALDKYVGKEKKAKTIVNKAQKARKKAAKFIKNLFG